MSKVHIHIRHDSSTATFDNRNKCRMCGNDICQSQGPEGLQCTKDAGHLDDHANEWKLGSKRWDNAT